MTTITLSDETLNKVNQSLNELIEIFKNFKLETVSDSQKVFYFKFNSVSDSQKVFEAVRNSRIDELKELIKAGVNVNIIDKNGISPLVYAQDPEITKILLEAGTDPNFKFPDGKNLLLYSSPEQMKILINAGVNVNHQDNDGNTVLYRITDTDRIKILIEEGADLTIRNKNGHTAEDFWRNCGYQKLLEYVNEFKLNQALESKETYTKEEVKELLEKLNKA